MADKLRIAFLGCGYMGQNAHMKNYFELRDQCDIVAIAEARPGLGKAVAAHYGVPHVFERYDQMLGSVEFDAVVSAQPFSNHIHIVPMVLESGKPMLTEKPLCVRPDNAVKLADLADRHRVLHMVGYHKRSDLASEYAKALVDEWRGSGEFGKLRLIRISMPPGNWVGGAPRPITTDESYPPIEAESPPDEFPGQLGKDYISFVNYYIHQVNYLHFMLGEPLAVDYADRSGVMLAASGDSGVCATLEMAAYETRDDWQEEIFIAFERGTIRVQLPAPLADRQPGRVFVMRGKREELMTTAEITLPRVAAMQNQAKNFIAAAKGERPAPCDSRRAADDLRFAADYIRKLNGI
ncbi:MAG: Gfo/Idh/MocA family oxidoreductase [Clostridiales bacterium]|nr:Gfo/Idh/MocA family oxidoreductase [Clostridiales bacterium]